MCRRLGIGIVRTGALAASVSLLAGSARAQQQSPVTGPPSIQPQIDIAGTGIATLDLGRKNSFATGGAASGGQVNFSDSSLALGFSQRMYRGGIGSFTLGGLTLDQSNTGRDSGIFVHQAFVDYQTVRFEAYAGRTDNPTAQLVQFPTLRGDDLVDFTYLQNPFSNGQNLEEHRFGNVAAVTFNQGLRHFENIHVQHLIDSSDTDGVDGTSLNSVGVSYQYMAVPTMEALARTVSYGVGYEHRDIPAVFGGSSEAVYGGGVFNLVPSLTNRIDFRILGAATLGNGTRGFGTVTDTYRADATSVAASVDYMNTPFGLPGSELSLTGGYKSYSKVSGAREIGLALTGKKRLGEGFDAVAQLGYVRRTDALAAVTGGNRDNFMLQLGLSFNFGATFNQNIGPRRTPLNTLYHHVGD